MELHHQHRDQHRTWGLWTLAVFAVALAALAALPSPAQSQDQTQSQSRAQASASQEARDEAAALEGFGEAISVDVVNVDVRVTDRKGRPVRGLGPDDFELLIDGKPVTVEYFQAVGFDADGQGTAEPQAPSEPPAAEASGQEPSTPAEPPRSYLVIFLDQLHLTTTGRRQLLRDLGPFIDRALGQKTPVMVASSAGGLQVLQKFTLDRDQVLSALSGQDEEVPGGVQEVVRYRSTTRELREILDNNKPCPPSGDPCDCAIPQMVATVRNQAAEVTGRVEDTLSAVDTLSSALRGLPGTKTVLLASDGLEFRPGLGLYRFVMDLCPTHEAEVSRYILDTDLLPVYQRVTSHAAANRVTIYSIDTAGIQPSNGVTEIPGTHLSQRAQEANLQHSLYLLADETGGEAVFNTNKFDQALEGVTRDMDAYYSLGFTPDHPGQDRTHTIDVKVQGDYHDLRYRKAFRHVSLDGRIAERMLGTLLFGVEQNELGIGASVSMADQDSGQDSGQASDQAMDQAAADGGEEPTGETLPVTVQVQIPLARLVFNPKPDGPVGLVRLLLTVQDVNGEWTPTRQKRVPIRLAPAEDPTTGSREVEVEMDLAPGDYLLAVGVRDELGGTISYLRKTFTVAPRT